VSAKPSGASAPVLTVPLHLALNFLDTTYGLHWAGTITLPATAPAGTWTVSAVATDNAGNSGPQFVSGSLSVS
jgi:hypothetical protein